MKDFINDYLDVVKNPTKKQYLSALNSFVKTVLLVVFLIVVFAFSFYPIKWLFIYILGGAAIIAFVNFKRYLLYKKEINKMFGTDGKNL